jgi:hypothetical protein
MCVLLDKQLQSRTTTTQGFLVETNYESLVEIVVTQRTMLSSMFNRLDKARQASCLFSVRTLPFVDVLRMFRAAYQRINRRIHTITRTIRSLDKRLGNETRLSSVISRTLLVQCQCHIRPYHTRFADTSRREYSVCSTAIQRCQRKLLR